MIGEIRQNFTEASASVGLILATALVAFFHVRTVKGAESNSFTCQLLSWQLYL